MQNKTELRSIIGQVTIIAVMWGMFVAFAYYLFFYVMNQGLVFDFSPRWYGARVMLQGINPYQVDVLIEELPTSSWRFYYPAHITYLLLPFWLLPFRVAVSLWSGLQLLLLVLFPAVMLNALKWKLSPAAVGILLACTLLMYKPAVNGFILGQFTTFSMFALVAAWWLHSKGHHPLLIALALIYATIRPEGILLVSIVLAYLLYKREWAALGFWGGIMGALVLLSFGQIGFWFPDFLDGVFGYGDRGTYAPALLFPPPFTTVFVIAVLGWAGWMLFTIRGLPEYVFTGAALSILIATMLIVLPQTKGYVLIFALLPIWLSGWLAREKWWAIPMMIALLCLPRLWDLLRIFEYGQLLTPLIICAALTAAWWASSKRRKIPLTN